MKSPHLSRSCRRKTVAAFRSRRRKAVAGSSLIRALASAPTFRALASAAIVLVTFAPSTLRAQIPNEAPPQTAPPPRTVVKSRQIIFKGTAITFQRLAPRAVETVPVQPVTTTAAPSTPFRPPANWSPPISISLGATIYENGVSELAWYHGGAVHRVLSSLDFSFVAGLGQFQWEGKNYLVFIAPSKVNNAAQRALRPAPLATDAPTARRGAERHRPRWEVALHPHANT